MKSKLLTSTVAVTILIGMIPTSAIAASSTKVKSLSEKEGYVSEVYMGASGKMIMQGAPKSKDDGLYYISGSTVKQLDKDDDLGTIESFVDKKYVVTDDSQQITVATGKVTDDYDLELDNLFYKKAKNSDVYKVGSTSDVTFDELERINNSSTWFYKFKDRYGVITEGGTYLDLSRYANLQVPAEDDKSMVTIKEFGEETKGLTATLKTIAPIAIDDTYLYFLCTVDVAGSSSSAKTYTTIMKTTKKAKVDDDTNFVSSVTSYVVDTEGKDSGDFTGADGFTARGGKLYAIHTGDTKVSIDILKTDRVKDDNGNRILSMVVDDTVSKEANTYTTDVYGNIWLMGSGKIYGFDGSSITQYFKVDSSCTNFQVYDSNNVIAWEDDGENYYIVTGASTTASDKDTDSDTDSDKDDSSKADTDSATDTDKDADNTKVTYTTGVNKLTNGSTVFSDDGTTLAKNTWKQVESKWKYFREDGTMATGWVRDIAYNVYHLDEATGDMSTGWYKDGRTNEWYYLGTDGAMKTGWQKVGSTWYYMFNTGMMAQGWIEAKGQWYYLGTDGAMRSNCYVGAYKLGSDGAWIK